MFLTNYLNRNITDQMVPMFEIIYCIEIIFIVLTNIFGGILVFVMFSTTFFHRIVRLRIIFGVLNAVFYTLSRAGVMYHEYFGPSTEVVTWYLVFGCVQKEVFLSYMVVLISILAIDRWVATKYWKWASFRYDRNGDSTRSIFFAKEFVVHIIGYAEGFLLAYELIPDLLTTCYLMTLTIAGSIGYTAIYRHNLRELEKLRMKAIIITYSVSRTYQIRENLAVLQLFNKIAIPLVLSTIPAFSFYLLYSLIPPDIGFDHFRYVCVAMFDLWLSMSCVLVISCIPLHEKKIIRYLLGHPVEGKVAPSQHVAVTNTYFTMLRQEWE